MVALLTLALAASFARMAPVESGTPAVRVREVHSSIAFGGCGTVMWPVQLMGLGAVAKTELAMPLTVTPTL